MDYGLLALSIYLVGFVLFLPACLLDIKWRGQPRSKIGTGIVTVLLTILWPLTLGLYFLILSRGTPEEQ